MKKKKNEKEKKKTLQGSTVATWVSQAVWKVLTRTWTAA